ncbi:MAG: hypothetical protein IJQ93_10535, partial [Bacteroidales bacterium]|nr:hypothetical protein [Bacteroidales bacterium]
MRRLIIVSVLMFLPLFVVAHTLSDSIRTITPMYEFKDGGSIRIWKSEQDSGQVQSVEATRSVAANRLSGLPPADTASSVGLIPVESSVSPYGGKIYSINVETASGFHFAPEVSLTYNSQSGNGIAGYGWDLTGIPSIRVISKNLYYHDMIQAAGESDVSAAFAIDGILLVQNDDVVTASSWPLVSVKGNILVKMHAGSNGIVKFFTARFPDGKTATFGFSSTTLGKDRYPLSELVDSDGNRIAFEYDNPWDILKQNYRLKRIHYGYDPLTGVYNARIEFSYSLRTDNTFQYHAGNYLSQRYKLNKITSYSGADVVAQYDLSYSFAEGVSLLKKIECTSSGKKLQPASFDYIADDVDPGGNNGLYLCSTAYLEESFVGFDDSNGYIYASGRFLHDLYCDGVVIYPNRSRYCWNERKWNWKKLKYEYTYGCDYSPSQRLLIVPRIDGLCTVSTITAGNGFQLLQAVDADGDGTDELVKINFGVNATNDKTLLSVGTYHINSSSGSYSFESSDLEIYGVVHDLGYSPIERDYYFGDYDGDGNVELLTVSSDRDFMGTSRTSVFSLINLNPISLIAETTAFSYTAEEDCSRIISVDIDSDGKTELCHISHNLDEAHVYSWNGQEFVARDTIDIPGIFFLNYGDVPVTDINADGYIDFIVPSQSDYSDSTWTIVNYCGRGNTSSFDIEAKPVLSTDRLFFRDMNRDGLSDVLILRDSILMFGINVDGRGFDFSNGGSINIGTDAKTIGCNILQFSGVNNLLTFSDYSINQYRAYDDRSGRRLMRYFSDGFGNYDRIIYDDLALENNSYMATAQRSYSLQNGFHKTVFPLFLTSQVRQRTNGGGLVGNYSYTYYDAAANNLGLGFCGFGKKETYDAISGTMVTEVSDPERLGVTTKVSRKLYNASSPFSTVAYTYDNHSTPHGKLNPRLTQSVETNALTGVTTTTTVSGYDSYDYPLGVVTAVQSGNDAPQTRTSVHTWQHAVSDSLYLLGLPSREVVESDADGNDASVHLVRTDGQFDARGHVTAVQQYVGEGVPGSLPSNLVQNKLYAHDAFGNVISEKTAAYGATTFNETSFTYDSLGRYLVSSTDPMGRTTTYSGYDKFGNPASVTDHAGLTTSYAYDAWGNLTQTTLPDGTVQTTTRAWSGSSEPGLYRVTTTATGSPIREYWYDALGREVRSASQRFDGSWQYVTTEYDSRGRLSRVSLPYKNASSGPSLWNSSVY